MVSDISTADNNSDARTLFFEAMTLKVSSGDLAGYWEAGHHVGLHVQDLIDEDVFYAVESHLDGLGLLPESDEVFDSLWASLQRALPPCMSTLPIEAKTYFVMGFLDGVSDLSMAINRKTPPC